MRRPHRSIEVFDISLMAVVTKAMGAFLVLMLLLMPYYSSGPVGREESEKLAKNVEDADKRIRDVLAKLTTAGPEELRTDLESTLQELKEPQALAAELKQSLDKLSAQVQRLEDQNAALTEQVKQPNKERDALKAQVAELEEKTKPVDDQQKETGITLLVSVLAPNCPDVRIGGAIVQVGRENAYVMGEEKKPVPSDLVLTGGLLSHGGDINLYDERNRIALPEKGPFVGFGFTNSSHALLAHTRLTGGTHAVIIFKMDRQAAWNALGISRPLLRSSATPCDLEIFASTLARSVAFSDSARTVRMKAEAIGGLLLMVVVDEKGVRYRAPNEKEQQWFDDLFAKTLATQNKSAAGQPR